MDTTKVGTFLRDYQSGNDAQASASDEPVFTGRIKSPRMENMAKQPAFMPDVQTAEAPADTQEEQIEREPTLSERIRGVVRDSASYSDDSTQEALQAGFGASKYDTDFYRGKDIEQARAVEQSGFAKVMSGLAKGGVTTLATAANTTAGLVYGLGSALWELAFDTNGNGRGFMDTMDAGVNNYVSEKLIKLQNWSEEAFPNYRTEGERSDQYQQEWWKHMGTGNFIGDSILKNFGFTVGAMLGGAGWSKLIGKAMSAKLAGDVMKGVAMASEGDGTASAELQRAAEAIRRGTVTGIDAAKLASNLHSVAQKMNSANARLQLYGSVISAMGEGTTEGLNAKDDFLEEYGSYLDGQYKSEYENLENEILKTGNRDWVRNIPYLNPDGVVLTYPELTEAGKAHLKKLQMDTVDKYDRMRQDAQEQAQRLASTTFLLNLPILTTSNMIQFGRLFSGGWRTNRANSKMISGGGLKGKGTEFAPYTQKGSVLGKTLKGSLKVALSEGSEEMLQGMASTGAKQVASHNLERITEFNDTGYDADSTDSVRDWLSSMYTGSVDYLGDAKNWQEGVLGALTGLFGIPSRRFSTWNGGVLGEYNQAKDEVRASHAAASSLNALVNSKEFQDRWRGYIRHMKYDNDMANATVADDQYAWHTADDNQLISDVVMFADAGRLDDLDRFVSRYGSVNASDAGEIRDFITGDNGNQMADWARNASDEDIVKRVKKQADRMKTAINDYKNLYEDLNARAPKTASPELIKETVFTAQQLKAMERRFMTMFGETMERLDPVLQAMASVGENGKALDQKEAANRYKNLRDNVEALFASSPLPVNLPGSIKKMMGEALDFMEELTSEADPETKQKIADMRKLTEARKEFFDKLRTLQTKKGQQEFEDSRITPEFVEQVAEQEHARQETDGLDSMYKVKESYFQKNAKDRAEYYDTLRAAQASNPYVRKFVEMYDTFMNLNTFLMNNGYMTDPNDMTVLPGMVSTLVNDAVRKADSREQFLNMDDNLLETKEQFTVAYQSPFGLISPTAYESAKKRLREGVEAFKLQQSDEATRGKSRQQAEQQKRSDTEQKKPEAGSGAFVKADQDENTSVPQGRDSSAPASLGMTPEEMIKRKALELRAEEERKRNGGGSPAPQATTEPPVQFILGNGDRTSSFTVERGSDGMARLRKRDGSNDARWKLSEIVDRTGSDDIYTALFGDKEAIPAYVDDDTVLHIKSVDIYPDGHADMEAELIAGEEEVDYGKKRDPINVADPARVMQLTTTGQAERFGLVSNGRVEQEARDRADEEAFGTPVNGEYDHGNRALDAERSQAEESEYDESVIEAVAEDQIEDLDTGVYMMPYYRTSVPEIDTGEAAKHRNAVKGNNWFDAMSADLSDFVIKHPEYKEIWNALAARGAFKYVDTELTVGSEIELMIDPAFPEYKGTPQILVTTRGKDGKPQVLTVLSGQTSRYVGLSELRDTIFGEYRKFKQEHPNEMYVFGKKSRVWGLRRGEMDYAPDSERDLNSLDGYRDGSIVFIDRDGEAKTVWGPEITAEDKKVFDKLKEKIKKDKEDGNKNTRAGSLYFITKSSTRPCPIALYTKHFNQETKDTDNEIFNRIRKNISRIVEIVHKADGVADIQPYYEYEKTLNKWNEVREKYADMTYTVKDGDGKETEVKIAPILDNVLTEATRQYNDGKKVDKALVKQFGELVPKIKDLNTDDYTTLHDPTGKDLAPINAEMHAALKDLRQDLDFHRWFFTIEHVENIGIALRVNDGIDSIVRRLPVIVKKANGEPKTDETTGKIVKIGDDQVTDKWLTDFFADRNMGIDVRMTTFMHNGKEVTGIKNINSLIDNGIITTNARTLHQKGADFYFDAWDAERREFRKLTDSQIIYASKQAQKNAKMDEQKPEIPGGTDTDTEARVGGSEESRTKKKLGGSLRGRMTNTKSTSSSSSDSHGSERSRADGKATAMSPSEVQEQEPEQPQKPTEVSLGNEERHVYSNEELSKFAVTEDFNSLPADVRKAMESKGYTEDTWSTGSDEDRLSELHCM